MLPQAADNTSPAAEALTGVEKLIEMLSVWEVGQSGKASVSVNPFMLIPSREYRGIIFQVNVWLDKAGEADVAGECVCTGGCYSGFLDETWPWQLCNEQIPAPLVCSMLWATNSSMSCSVKFRTHQRLVLLKCADLHKESLSCRPQAGPSI